MNKLFPKVDWRTGDVLTALHLRAQDHYFESLLRFRAQSESWSSWGLLSLKIDSAKIDSGIFSLAQATGVFIDGLAFDIPASDAPPLSISLNTYANNKQEILDIFLAIPDEGAATPNMAQEYPSNLNRTAAERSRFVMPEHTDRTDEADDCPVEIPFLRKNFRLIIFEEPAIEDVQMIRGTGPSARPKSQEKKRRRPVLQNGWLLLQIAKLKRIGEGYRLDEAFIPPLLDIGASPYLRHQIADNVLRKVKQKISVLDSDIRPFKSMDISTMNRIEIGRVCYLLAINNHLPALKNLCDSIDYPGQPRSSLCHPKDLYEVFAALASSLTTFSFASSLEDVPAYNHTDLSDTFAKLSELLGVLLGLELSGNALRFRFRAALGQIRLVQTDPIEPRHFASGKIYIAARGQDRDGAPRIMGEDLGGIDFSWLPKGATSQLAFANPIPLQKRAEPNCNRRRGYAYYPLPSPRSAELTGDIRLQARWGETWKDLDLELVFLFEHSPT